FCGSTCQVTIVAAGPMQGGNDRILETAAGEELQLWPNPVRDGRVTLRLEGITDTDQRITVDVYDAFGKRVIAEQFANTGDLFNTTLDLGRETAAGLYMVHVNINGRTYVKHLSVL
ncbi:MAG: T9SS type A sorting domain-containing protein, partial [Flavobacteriales bacterium]|nr:T9SS type A sorting domain-containing protein [Flavobacteriales bacterium]